jgi:AraC family transcriptional regulator
MFWLAFKLYAETRAPLEASDLHLESLVAELLGVTACKPDRSHDAPWWLRRTKEKLKAEYVQRLTLQDLARDAQIHPVHLSRSFRRFTGYGLGEYVQRLRVREACEMMMNPKRSLADISTATGFADQSHFTRTCHAITGATPGALRAIVRDAGVTAVATLCPRPS